MHRKITASIMLTVLLILAGNFYQIARPETKTPASQEQIVRPPTQTDSFVYYGITDGKIRQNLLYYGYTLSVLDMRQDEQLQEGAIDAKAGYRLISLQIRLASSDEEGAEISPTSIYLKDSQERRYNALDYGLLPGFFDQPAYLSDGDKLQGWLTFEIPETATRLVFCQELPLDNILFVVELPQV